MLNTPQDLQDMANRDFRDLASEEFDTRTLLRNAVNQAIDRKYEDFLIVDTDSHHYETEAFKEIAEYIDDPVMRYEAKFQGHSRGGFTAETGSYQEIAGRITRYPQRKNEKVPNTKHRDLTLMERWMDAMGVDMAVMFPTPMLNLSNCPRIEVEVAMAKAYNRWLCDKILDADPRIRSMLYLPFHDPEATYQIIEEFADRKGVCGFMVTSTHYRANYDNAYMKSYHALQERDLPLGFHAAFTWTDQSLQLTNRFHRRPCTGLHLVQHAAHDQLGHQRHAGAFSEAEDGVDRKRAGVDSVPDAAARQRVHDAHLGLRFAQAQAKRLHARNVFHLAADGNGRQPQGARTDFRDDQRRDAAALFVGLSTLGHGPAVDDLRSTVPQRTGQTQHSRRQRPEAIQARSGLFAGEA
jgi:hypothetical protein